MSVRRLLGRKTLQRLGSLTILAASATSAAHAADYLRGAYAPDAEPKNSGVDWAGVYVGVHAGISAARSDYSALGPQLGRNVLPSLAITDQIPG